MSKKEAKCTSSHPNNEGNFMLVCIVLQVNRFVEVNFNCLETTVNLETWVLVLEFIGIGGKFVNPELFTRLAQQARIEEMASGISTIGVHHFHMCVCVCV